MSQFSPANDSFGLTHDLGSYLFVGVPSLLVQQLDLEVPKFHKLTQLGRPAGKFPRTRFGLTRASVFSMLEGSVKWLQMQTFPKNRGEQDNPCRIVWWNPKNELIALRFSPAELIFALQCTMVPWHPPRPHNMQEFDNGINWTNVFRGLVQEPYVFSLCDNESRFHRTPFLSLHPTQHASCPDFCTDSFYHRIGSVLLREGNVSESGMYSPNGNSNYGKKTW